MQLKHKLLVLLVVLFIAPARLLAQENQFSGWAAWFHSQRLSEHWGYSFDGQFRSHDDLSYLKHTLLRPSANYYFANNKVAALGYAYIATKGLYSRLSRKPIPLKWMSRLFCAKAAVLLMKIIITKRYSFLSMG